MVILGTFFPLFGLLPRLIGNGIVFTSEYVAKAKKQEDKEERCNVCEYFAVTIVNPLSSSSFPPT